MLQPMRDMLLYNIGAILFTAPRAYWLLFLPLDTVVSGDSINRAKCGSGIWKQQQTQGQVHNFSCDVIFGVWFWCVRVCPGRVGGLVKKQHSRGRKVRWWRCRELWVVMTYDDIENRAESFLSPQVRGQTSHSLTWWFIPWASHNLQSHWELSVCCVCMVLCEVGSVLSVALCV